MMSPASLDLPEFDNPPLHETALGIQFAPIKGWSVVHFGLFWQSIRDAYPEFDVKPPFAARTEEFGVKRPAAPTPSVEIVDLPEIRCWYISADRSRLLQVQRDCMYHNWRRLTGVEVYPRYDAILPQVIDSWDALCHFLKSENMPAPNVKQCEVTYINHILKDDGWTDFGQFDHIFANWSRSTTDAFLPAPESVSVESRYIIGQNQGRLHLRVVPAIRNSDGQELLQITLTARGRPADSGREGIREWLDLGHEWVVRGFADVTSHSMHLRWRRIGENV